MDDHDWVTTRWHHLVPDDWVAKDGRTWGEMCNHTRNVEPWINPKLKWIMPQWWRDQRARHLRYSRSLVDDPDVCCVGDPRLAKKIDRKNEK